MEGVGSIHKVMMPRFSARAAPTPGPEFRVRYPSDPDDRFQLADSPHAPPWTVTRLSSKKQNLTQATPARVSDRRLKYYRRSDAPAVTLVNTTGRARILVTVITE